MVDKTRARTFTFHVEDLDYENPVRVIVEYQVEEDEDSAENRAREAICSRHGIDTDEWGDKIRFELNDREIILLETVATHPDHFLGMSEEDMGIWL